MLAVDIDRVVDIKTFTLTVEMSTTFGPFGRARCHGAKSAMKQSISQDGK